jgi:hypothetical protein
MGGGGGGWDSAPGSRDGGTRAHPCCRRPQGAPLTPPPPRRRSAGPPPPPAPPPPQGGVVYANAVTTVSPSYANEILTGGAAGAAGARRGAIWRAPGVLIHLPCLAPDAPARPRRCACALELL